MNTGMRGPTPFISDEQRLAASRSLRADLERRVDAALSSLDPSRPALVALAAETEELRAEVARLRAELGARRAAAPAPVGPRPRMPTVLVGEDGRTWETWETWEVTR